MARSFAKQGNQFNETLNNSGRGHPQAGDQPINNKELKQTNELKVTKTTHPGIREPRA